MMKARSRVTPVSLPVKTLGGGLKPPHDITNDESSATAKKLPSISSRKCKHRWRINVNAKVSLHFRPEWYALLLNVSFVRRIFREVQVDLPRLSNVIKAHLE